MLYITSLVPLCSKTRSMYPLSTFSQFLPPMIITEYSNENLFYIASISCTFLCTLWVINKYELRMGANPLIKCIHVHFGNIFRTCQESKSFDLLFLLFLTKVLNNIILGYTIILALHTVIHLRDFSDIEVSECWMMHSLQKRI